jgi:hypothetical protein
MPRSHSPTHHHVWAFFLQQINQAMYSICAPFSRLNLQCLNHRPVSKCKEYTRNAALLLAERKSILIASQKETAISSLREKEKGMIINLELQKKFLLQEKFP